MQLRELELIDTIVMRGIRDHSTRFEDYPVLNNELKKIKKELYSEEEDEELLMGDIVPSWRYEEY